MPLHVDVRLRRMATVVNLELPQNDEAERSVLGAILVSNEHYDEVADILNPEDFYRPSHRRVFASMRAMRGAGEPIDVITLGERHVGDAVIDAVGGVTFISRLMDGIPRLVNVRHYASIVRERAIRREMVRLGTEMAEEASLGEQDPLRLAESVKARLDGLRSRDGVERLKHWQVGMEETLDFVEARSKNQGQLIGAPTGFEELDRTTCGLQDTDLIILAGATSMGKSALAAHFMMSAARAGRAVALFSLEMSQLQVCIRAFSTEARIPSDRLMAGQMTDHHWARLLQRFPGMAGLPIYIDDSGDVDIHEIRRRCERRHKETPLGLVVIDHLGLVRRDDVDRGVRSDASSVGLISQQAKLLAMTLKLPVLLVCQLSRDLFRTGNKRPQLWMLKQSGDTENNANAVLFVHREEYYWKREKDTAKEPVPADIKGKATIIVAKQRMGAIRDIHVEFDEPTTRFKDLPQANQEGARHGDEGSSARREVPIPEGSARLAPRGLFDPEDD